MEKELTPSEYFEMLKDKKNKITDQELQRIYDNCLFLLNEHFAKLDFLDKSIKNKALDK